MALPSTKEIKVAIATIIKARIGSDDSTNKPKVYPWNVLKPLGVDDRDKATILAEWAGLFSYRPITDTVPVIVYGDPIVHGWMIKRVNRDSELRNAGCEDVMAEFDVWGFYGFRKGTASSNSEDEVDALVDNLCGDFKGGLLLAGSISIAHEGLQFPVLSTMRSGDKANHFLGGRIQFNYGD